MPTQTEPPSAPQNLTVNFNDQSTVILTWQPPKYLGGRNDTVYRVVCDMCSPSVNYVPAAEGFNETKAVISGLSPITKYKFQVYAENGVSGYDASQYAEVFATTEASGTFTSLSLITCESRSERLSGELVCVCVCVHVPMHSAIIGECASLERVSMAPDTISFGPVYLVAARPVLLLFSQSNVLVPVCVCRP